MVEEGEGEDTDTTRGGRGEVKVCESLILLTHQAWTNTVVTDGRTDGRTESRQDAVTREKAKVSYYARFHWNSHELWLKDLNEPPESSATSSLFTVYEF